MSYGYSSTYPRVPNPTPQLPSSIRPPIHNPYDKFTQPQFDEWIGGITNALKKALGQEEEALTSRGTEPREEDLHPVADINDDSVEDSFAEWRAVRTKEKGKMRATEREQDSECGDSQESYEDSDAQDHTAGNTPRDAIELLSDEDDDKDEDANYPGVYDDESYGGGFIQNSSSAERTSEPQQPVAASSRLASPSKLHDFFVNATGQEAIEISDGETEEHDQSNDFPDAENVFFGWGQEEEVQQIPDIRDPWELPKTYAEDLYTGGPIREPDRARLSPSHLTPVSEDANHLDSIDPQLRPSSVLVSKPTDHNLAEVSRGSATPAPIPSVTEEVSNGDDEVSLYDEDFMEPDTPTGATPRDEPDFISFTALNQPSDIDSERGGPEILYISDNDGRESNTDDEEAEQDGSDEDGPIPLGTSDLEIPAEHNLDEDREEELDELEDDDEPVPEVSINSRYGYYGLDASSVTGSGGIDDEAKTAGPPSDPSKGDQGEAPAAAVSQESASTFDPRDPTPLPAATAFIEIDQSTVSIDDTTKISLAGVSLASLDSIFTDEAVAGKDDEDNAEDTVGDDTILADETVLTMNEVEEVLRHAFATADRSASIPSDQGATLVSDVTPSIEEPAEGTSQRPDLSGTASEIFVGEGPLPREQPIEGGGRSPIEASHSTTKDKLMSPQEQSQPLPFIMPLVANPNVRDPMSAPWSPVQSGPPTPVAGLVYLPAVTKFKRDNQLPGTVNTGSGLFTPLEGSGSSSPSPSDDGATPEDQLSPDAETEITVAEVDEQRLEERATSVLTSPTTTPPETTETVPAGPSEGDGWGDIPRLPTPPTEREDLPTGPVTRVFFQPEAPGDVGGLDARTGAGRGGDALAALAVDTPREGNGGPSRLGDAKPLFHTMGDTGIPKVTEPDDPFKLMGNDSTVAPGAVTNDDDGSSIASSSPDEERTPRLKISEISASMAEDSRTVGSIHPEIQLTSRSPTQVQKSVATPTETRKNLRKRKRSESIPINPEDSGSGSKTKGEVSGVVTASLGNEERDKAGLTGDKPRDRGEVHDSDNESFTSSLIAPRNAGPSSHNGSRASSVVSERPLLLQGHSPVAEDAPVFHGHGKFKATLQALKALRRERNPSRELEPETKKVEEKKQEKERPVAVKMGSRKSSENDSNIKTETKKPPPLILPEMSVQPSLPSASTSQSPSTPISALPPSSPTIVTVPAEVTPPLHQEQTAQESAEPEREVTQKPAIKTAKRTASRKRVPLERRSTRSQCRYHKISLPREEDGPRVTFCVPQCSINNKELMEEEDITDDGLATVRDFDLLWDQIEEKDLSPYLIGTIRQLVGVDLLRENEVYYLPTEEEVERMEQKVKKERRKSRKSIGGAANVEGSNIAGRSDSVSTAGSAFQPSRSQVEKGKAGPPSSFAGSISTVSTRSKIGQEGSIRSISEDEVSGGEGGERAPKRRRRAGRERGGEGGSRRNTPSVIEDSVAPASTAGSPAPSQPMIERTPARRSRRKLRKATSADVHAYKPPVSSDGESSEDEAENVKARRKSARGGMKGLKRRRTDYIVTCSGTMPIVSGDRDGPPSPISTRSKRAKIEEK